MKSISGVDWSDRITSTRLVLGWARADVKEKLFLVRGQDCASPSWVSTLSKRESET